MLKFAIVGNWAELTVAPGVHPEASVMVVAPRGRGLLKTHLSTVLLDCNVQVGAVVSLPDIVAEPTPVKYPAAGSVNSINELVARLVEVVNPIARVPLDAVPILARSDVV